MNRAAGESAASPARFGGVPGIHVVVVDDEAGQREILVDILSDEGYEVRAFSSAREALVSLEAEGAELVLTDLRMPEMDGLELLERLKESRPEIPVLLMTAYGSVSSAVAAMKRGAFDYLQKPFEKDELVQRVRRVAERHSLVRENLRLRRELTAQASPQILGRSKVIRDLLRRMERIAELAGDVLVAGESGTGKELVARALHYGGPRAAAPFVPVNCAAIPEGLAESELFGHEKGAFTHATSDRAGRFEQADGGTLFLDEISAMPMALQAKLLRVLQDRMVERVGSHRPRKVDLRIVAATNRDLTDRIREGSFREDLYHRLNVHEIWIPPLRERGEDIVLLAESFRDRAAARFGMPAPDLDESLLDFLRGYTFPGNVRELEHTMEKMVALSDGEPLGIADLPPSVRRSRPGVSAENAVRRGAVQAGAAPADGSFEDSLGGAVHAVPGRLAAAAGVGPEERAIGPDGPTNKATDGAADGAANGATDGSADGARGRGRAGEEATAGDATDRADRFGTLASGPPGAGGGASPEDLLARGPISLFDVERRLLEEAIRRSGGNLSEAARRLGISYKTMRYRARKFDLDE